MRRIVLCAALLSFVPVLPSAPAVAQDWSVKRDPFDRRLIARYKRILDGNPSDKAALAKLSTLYKRHRSLALLVSEYEKELAKKPNDFATLVVLGHLALQQGKQDQALAYLARAAAERPASVTVQSALGKHRHSLGDLAGAREAYEAALAAAKKPAAKKAILRALADVALAAKDITAAKRYFEQYIALDPRNVQAQIELGDALLRHDRHADAIEAFRAAEKRLRTDPAQRVEVIARIGAAHEKADQPDQAVAEYRRAISLTRRGYYLRRELTERIVDIYRRRQDLATLAAHYEKTWPVARRDHFEWDILARLYEETGVAEKAIAAYRKAVAKAPYELDTQRRLITLLENSGREADALARYEAVVKVAPGEPRFQLELAERYWKAGNEKKALALVDRIERRFAGDPGVHSTLADLFSRWGKEDRALAAYERLTRIEPDDPRHLVDLGEQYYQRNQKKKAKQIWKKILRGGNAASYARLGQVYAEHDLLDDALAMYERAIKAEPKQAEYYKGRGSVYERLRRWNEAVSDWEEVLALTPDKAADQPTRREARRRVVHLLTRAGKAKLRERMTVWNRAFGDDPPNLNAGYYLVEAYLREDDSARARQVLEKLLALRPDDSDAMNQLVKVYRAERDYQSAIALLLELAAKSPGREREYYNQVAEIKTILHEDDDAIRYAQKALEKSPSDPVAHARLAERYLAMQKYDEAIAAYEKAVELSPRSFKPYFELARLYLNKDELAAAAALYREVLRRASDEEILYKAGREAIELEELTGTLADLERTLSPLVATYGHKPVYRRVLVELYDRLVPALVQEDSDAARTKLAELGAHGLSPLLEALADDKDVAQQRIAVSVLGYLGNAAAAAPLVRLAEKPPDEDDRRRARIGTLIPTLGWDVRVEALVAAGRLGDPRTIPDLTRLAAHREVAMREAAVFALGITRSDRALAPLTRALGDSRSSVQTLACLGLGRLGGKKTIAKIGEALRDEERSDATRAACAYALGTLGDASSRSALESAIEHGNDQAQRLAAWALGRLGDSRAVPALLGAYFSKREPVREAVAWALPFVSSGKPAPAVEPRATFPMRNGKLDEDALVRSLVPALDPPPLVPALIVGNETRIAAGLRDSLRRHRDLIVRVLGDLDARPGDLALGPLTAGLDRASARDAKAVRRALDAIGAELAPDLIDLTRHRDPEVRRRALSVVAKIGTPAAEPALAQGLADESPAVRRGAMLAAAGYVARRGDRESALAAAVTARLEADDWRERVAAARALARFGVAADRAALARALKGDRKSFVREAAARALGKLGGGAPVIAALAEALTARAEPVIAVRVAAARSLATLGGDRARAALSRAAKADPSSRVQAAARAGLAPRKK